MDSRLEKISRLNYWNGNRFENGVVRQDYLDKIMPFTGSRIIKVLTGQRRAGKSYVMRQVIQCLLDSGRATARQVLYVNKELYEFSFLATADDLMGLVECYFQVINPEGKSWVFFDEVQSIAGWERVADSLSQDPSLDCEVFVTGSNSHLLSGELATLLSGRYVEVEVQPFSFKEHLLAQHIATAARPQFLGYLTTGGLPEFLNLKGEETRRHYVESVKNTIVLKDIVERHKVKDAYLLERICAYLVNNSSSLVSISNIVNFLNNERLSRTAAQRKASYDTVSNYINYLQETFLIRKVERYDVKGKEILTGTAKYYANDNCYHNYLYAGYGYGQGALLENYVFQALKRTGFSCWVGRNGRREIDFVARKQDRLLYVQSSWTLDGADTEQREYDALQNIPDNYPKIIVSMDDVARHSRLGIDNIQAWNLEDYLRSF